jgi:hypothetical protein
VQARVVSIEDGDWLQRFLLGCFAGQAHFEIEGTATNAAGTERPFHFRQRSFGFWLNSNMECLTAAMRGPVGRIAKLVKKK